MNNISLEEKKGQWEFDSNWSYVRLVKWSKKDKEGNDIRYALTGRITPDNSLPMYAVSIIKDGTSSAKVLMREEFDNLASFLVFIKQHMKEFPGLNNELLDTFIKYRKEQSRMDESIDLDKKYGDSETLEDGWTLSYDGYQAKLERADRLDNGSLRRYEVAINTHPSRLEEWMANYFINIWDESISVNKQEYGYRSNNLLDLIREFDKVMNKFPGMTKEMFNKLVKLSEEAKKHSKEKFSQEEKESIEVRNNKWFLNDNEKNHIFLAKDINAYEGNKHVVLRIVLEAFPSNKKDINDQYKLKIYKINYADGTNEIVTSKEFNDLLDFTAFMYRNLSAYNIEKEDIDLLISKCKENSSNKKSFNNIFLYDTQESIEDYLSEGLEDNIVLDETTLKDLLTAAGVLGLAGAGSYYVDKGIEKILNNDTELSQSVDQPTNDYLKVPEYKDMPNLWDTEKSNKNIQKVSVQDKPDNNVVSKKNWTADTWTDSQGNVFELDSALDFIADIEKFRPKAYPDGYLKKNGKKIKRYSIGFGTLAPNNNPNDVISLEQAKADMINHVKKHILPKFQHMIFNSQNQFNSAVSFTYNTGKIPPLNNQGNIDWERFQSYNRFQGKENPGLVRRRNAEFFNAQLFDEL